METTVIITKINAKKSHYQKTFGRIIVGTDRLQIASYSHLNPSARTL